MASVGNSFGQKKKSVTHSVCICVQFIRSSIYVLVFQHFIIIFFRSTIVSLRTRASKHYELAKSCVDSMKTFANS